MFTFKGIQSSKGVPLNRETGLVYNNVYPDVDRRPGLIIPKTLVKTEDRPKSQMKTSRHKRKRIESLADVKEKLKKPRRVKQQREDWKTQETNKEIVKEWQPKKKRAIKEAKCSEAKETKHAETEEVKCSGSKESDQEIKAKKADYFEVIE